MVALLIFCSILILSVIIAILARRGLVTNNMSDIMVASGSFGPFLLFFISVGEIYSVGTLVGGPGAIYAHGANYGVWNICYILLAYAIGYFFNPAIWRLGQLSKAVTISDLLGWRFNSKAIQVLTAIICIIFLMPWVQNQFAGMAIILRYLNLGIDFTPAVIISAIIAFTYVATAGIRSSAYVSILKDVLMIVSIVAIGVAAAMAMPGGVGGIFRAVAAKSPSFLTVTTRPITAGGTFVLSTIVFQMLGFYLLPFTLQGTLTSKSEKNLRRNSIYMPLYMMMWVFLVITAYYALLTVPGLKVPDYALLAVYVRLLPSWVVGLMAGGAALTGVLVMAVSALAVGGLFSKNVLGVVKPDMGQRQMVRWTQMATASFLIGGVVLALYYPALIARVVTIAYSGLTQTFVGMMFAFFWRRSTKWGVGAGLLVGTAMLFLLQTVPYGLNKGFIALLINLFVAVVVSLITKPDPETESRFDAYVSRTKGCVAVNEKADARPSQVV